MPGKREGAPLTSSCSRSSQAPSSPSSRSCAEPRARSGRNSPLWVRPKGRDRLDPAAIPTVGRVMNPCPMNVSKKSGIAALRSHLSPPLAPLYPDTCEFSSSCSVFSMLFSVFSLSCAILCVFCVSFRIFCTSHCIFHNSCAVFPVFCTFHISYATFPTLCIFLIFHVTSPVISNISHISYGVFCKVSYVIPSSLSPVFPPYPFWVTSNLIPRELRSLRSPRCPRSSRSRNRARNSGEGGGESVTTPGDIPASGTPPHTPDSQDVPGQSVFLTTLVLSRCASSCGGVRDNMGGPRGPKGAPGTRRVGHGGRVAGGGSLTALGWGNSKRTKVSRSPGATPGGTQGSRCAAAPAPGPVPSSSFLIPHSQFPQSLTCRHWEADPSLYSQLQVAAAQLREHPTGEGRGTCQTSPRLKPPTKLCHPHSRCASAPDMPHTFPSQVPPR